MQQPITSIVTGWPEARREVTSYEIRQYYNVRQDLIVQDGLIFRGQRIVIPQSYRQKLLERIHSSHIGINGCIRRARDCVYWPGINSAVEEYVEKCSICRTFETTQQKETLQSHDVPNIPWAKLGADLFTFQDKEYLITVDYYSNFFEVDRLDATTSVEVIYQLKKHFARHGIPELLITDNEAQFSSIRFQKFCKTWNFAHRTSSPGHPIKWESRKRRKDVETTDEESTNRLLASSFRLQKYTDSRDDIKPSSKAYKPKEYDIVATSNVVATTQSYQRIQNNATNKGQKKEVL